MLNGLCGTPAQPRGPVPAAATCYDHLAGELGVALMDHLIQTRGLQPRDGEGELKLGPAAGRAFPELGVELPTKPGRRALAFSCMDSLIGRPHLGGQLGAQLAASLRQTGWVNPPSSRAASNSHQPAPEPYSSSASASTGPSTTRRTTTTDTGEPLRDEHLLLLDDADLAHNDKALLCAVCRAGTAGGGISGPAPAASVSPVRQAGPRGLRGHRPASVSVRYSSSLTRGSQPTGRPTAG